MHPFDIFIASAQLLSPLSFLDRARSNRVEEKKKKRKKRKEEKKKKERKDNEEESSRGIATEMCNKRIVGQRSGTSIEASLFEDDLRISRYGT